MAKYRIKATDEPVKVGDMITTTKEKKTSFGVIKITESVLVTEELIPVLINDNIIEEVKAIKFNSNNSTIIKVNDDISYYINKLAKQLTMNPSSLVNLLDNMNKVCPTAVLSMLLRTISNEYCIVENKKISQHKGYYWYISMVDGSINRLVTARTNWEHITLFKEKAYAENAKNILKEQFKFMYGK